MYNVTICRAQEEDAPYIEEKLGKYFLDSTNANWQQFFVVKYNNKTVAFGRVIDHTDFFEIASLGVDYYHREKGAGSRVLSFLVEEAQRMNSQKAIYGVTHRPGFVEKAGFKEVANAPEALEYKKSKCLDPSKIKIMKVGSS